MTFKLFGAAALVAACVALAGNSGSSFVPQDENDAGKKSQDGWAKIQAAAAPGEPHKMLAKLEGTWDQKMECPGEGMTSTGTIRYRSVLGGRFVVGESTAAMKSTKPAGKADGAGNGHADHPWEALCIFGYDNVSKKHFVTHSDTMGTGMFVAEGAADPANKTITYEGTMKDAMTPQGRPFKVVVKSESDDRTVIELWDARDGKAPARSCTITETRQK